MARVRALRVCFVDNGLRQQGDVFEYNGPTNGNLELIDKPAKPVEETETVEVVVPRPRRGRPARNPDAA